MRIAALVCASVLASCCVAASHAAEPQFPPEHVEFFEKKVRPLLVRRCTNCHGAEKQEAGLRLDARSFVLKGSDSGEVVDSEALDDSTLISAIRYEDYEMPPSGKMPPEEIAVIEQWVKLDLPWPAEETPAPERTFDQLLEDHQQTHWAYQPVSNPAPPQVDAEVENDLDRYVAKKLFDQGMSMSDRADRRTLIRRATMDLHGVPPTSEEVKQFVANDQPDAYEKLIDRLLASPKYGEKWGRHWLDVARYSDTRGYALANVEPRLPFAYAYRDYVIDSINRDTPYNEFIREQLAADYFAEEGDRRLAALGLLRVGRQFLKGEDTLDDQIDVVTRGFLGLTVSCARCHDHKYDAFSMADYYGLYGVFDSVEPTMPLVGPIDQDPKYPQYKARKDEIEQEIADFDKKHAQVVREQATQHVFDLLIRAVSKIDDTEIEGKKFPQSTLKGKDIRPHLVRQWDRFLDRKKPADPIWGPLVETRKLGDQPYKEQHAKLLEKWIGNDKLRGILRDPLAEKRPSTLAELVGVYSDVIGQLMKKLPGGQFEPSLVSKQPQPWQQLAHSLKEGDSPIFLNDSDYSSSRSQRDRNDRRKIESKLQRHQSTGEGAPPRALAVKDRDRPREPVIFLRGNRGRRGDRVPREFIEVLSDKDDPSFQKGSGRLELAEHIASPENPLTARVMVNRVWMGHFDQSLVLTPGDFGIRCEEPVQQELLDHLAYYFMNHDWSMKQLHKYIMLSSVYQQQSFDRPELRAKDPENQLYWKMNRRRLSFEEMRDSLLSVSGKMDWQVGGRPVEIDKQPYPFRRTIYGFINRQDLPNLYRAFDFPSPDATSPQRSKTSVPQQTLFLLNSKFVQRQAKLVVENSLEDPKAADADRLSWLFATVLQRSPTDQEATAILAYVSSASAELKNEQAIWENVAQVLMVSNEFMFVD